MNELLRTDRRTFLKIGGSAGLATLSGLSALPARSVLASDGATPKGFFSEREREILTAVVERMVETGEAGAPAVRDTGAVQVIDDACASLAPAVTELLPTALRLFEWWPFFGELRFRRFSELGPTEQDASLEGWMTSRIDTRRLAFYALRNLSLLGYWSQEETWPLIGYQGPLIARRRPDTENAS